MAENADIWREIAELRGRLEAVAMPFCQSKADVEDLVSRAIERAVGNAAKYNAEKGNLFSWVRTILVNLAVDDARAREIRKTYSCDMDELANDEAMATSSTDERILASSDEEALKAAINRLAPEYKKTVIMHYMMDMPLKEIAKVLHRPIGTVKWRLSVAKDVLAGMLKKTLGRPSVWVFLALGLITGCVATYLAMRLPSRRAGEWPAGGQAFNTPKVHEVTVRRAPKEVKIDGDLGEWTAPVFESACNPPYDRDYSASIRMMWDEKRLYIGGDIRTPDPMCNMSSACGTWPFAGGSVICRLAATDTLGWPLPDEMVYYAPRMGPGPAPDARLVSLMMLYDCASGAASLFVHNKMRRQKSLDVPSDAWCGAYRKHRDGRGYTFEYAVDWHSIEVDPPKSGEIRANTWNIHFSDDKGLVCTGQISENARDPIPDCYKSLRPVSYCYWPQLWGKAVFD